MMTVKRTANHQPTTRKEPFSNLASQQFTVINPVFLFTSTNKKLSYCWETVRCESKPMVAEMDVEMTS